MEAREREREPDVELGEVILIRRLRFFFWFTSIFFTFYCLHYHTPTKSPLTSLPILY